MQISVQKQKKELMTFLIHLTNYKYTIGITTIPMVFFFIVIL